MCPVVAVKSWSEQFHLRLPSAFSHGFQIVQALDSPLLLYIFCSKKPFTEKN